MSGVKEKQAHTLFGQIELLASCSRHICVVHTQQLQQNIFQLYPSLLDEVEANRSVYCPCRVHDMLAGMQPHHVFSKGYAPDTSYMVLYYQHADY